MNSSLTKYSDSPRKSSNQEPPKVILRWGITFNDFGVRSSGLKRDMLIVSVATVIDLRGAAITV